MRFPRDVILGICLVLAAAGDIPAQAPVPLTVAWTPTTEAPLAPIRAAPAGGSVRPALLSLALPGAGQFRLGQRRAWAYAALEVLAWAFHLERSASGRDFRGRYRDLAWNDARPHTQPRRDGDWTYYETLTEWVRSGAYDRDPSRAGTQPELDATTFNGSIWALAKQIYLPGGSSVPEDDPAYRSALAYYESRAYGSAFLWDWSPLPASQARYRTLIDRSDERFRQATIALGAVFANHLVSAADAYLSGRAPEEGARLTFEPDMGPGGVRWTAHVRLPLAR